VAQVRKSPLNSTAAAAADGDFFRLFLHLGAALAKSIKADRTDDFFSEPKGATPERLLRRKTIKL
jgi:hypothetical protein